MPFEIIRNDLTKLAVDAIVNTANPRPVIGAGTDAAVYAAAGPELLSARRKIGEIRPGEARITAGFGLPARHVIHTVGPVWIDGQHHEAEILHSCYEASLRLAAESGCRSVAFPLISAGTYGFPKALALDIAIDAIRSFLQSHEMQVTLAVFQREAYALSKQRMDAVRSFIDEAYVEQAEAREAPPALFAAPSRRAEDAAFLTRNAPPPELSVCSSVTGPEDLDVLLAQRDAGFAETLVELIERSGRKNSEIYKKANVDKKLFSKIIHNVNYHPSKPTAVAFAVALELDWDQTRDLVARAGYSMTHSSKFDIIIEYFLMHKNYDLFEINETLFAFDQSLLGC